MTIDSTVKCFAQLPSTPSTAINSASSPSLPFIRIQRNLRTTTTCIIPKTGRKWPKSFLLYRSCYTDRTPRHFKTSVYNMYCDFKSVFSRLVFQENSVLLLDILVIYVRTLTHVHAFSICSPCHYSLSFLIVSLSQLITREHNLLV